jgi:hypothetical protein
MMLCTLCPSNAISRGERLVALRATDWLRFAAAPTFALMAVVTGFCSSQDIVRSTADGAWPLGGMVPMYVLMSVFHCAPRLKLVAKWRSGSAPPAEPASPDGVVQAKST